MIDWGLTSSSVKCLWVSFYWRASTTDILVEATANCVETRDGSDDIKKNGIHGIEITII